MNLMEDEVKGIHHNGRRPHWTKSSICCLDSQDSQFWFKHGPAQPQLVLSKYQSEVVHIIRSYRKHCYNAYIYLQYSNCIKASHYN